MKPWRNATDTYTTPPSSPHVRWWWPAIRSSNWSSRWSFATKVEHTDAHTLLGSFYDQRRAFKATVSRRRKSTERKKTERHEGFFSLFFLAILLPVDAADKIATPPDSKARGLLHLVLRKIPQPTPHEPRGGSEKRENAARGEKDSLHIII